MFFKPKTLFGLDIGSSYIKAVQLKKLKKAGYELEIFDILPIQPGLVDDGAVINKDKLADSIKALIKKANIKSSYVAVSISGHSSVIIKIISMPEMNEDEMAKSIRFEAEQYVPFGIDDVNLDFQILGKRKDDSQVDVLLVAVKKDLLEDYYKVLEMSEITPAVIDVTAFALANMYEFNYGHVKAEGEEEKVAAIFDVGAGNINMTVIKKNNPAFTRDSAIGARIITESLEKNFQIDYDTAEGILKDGTLPAGMSADEVSPIIMNASEQVMTDIIGSLDYYMSSYNDHIDKVLVCGGGALLGQFAEILAERTGLEVLMTDPFKNITIPNSFDKEFIKKMGPIGAAAMGLALREIGDK
ncbi:MAG: type IV pilus assembly protein PilM [Nitrospirae bacterium]|nr:type IV pilus assembly protein PilM [Nitrospirota bacterium]